MTEAPPCLPVLKTCTACRQCKPFDTFDQHRDRRDGRASQCKSCRRKANHAWYERRKGKSVVPKPRFTPEDLTSIRARGEQRCIHCNQALPLAAFDVSQVTGHPRRVCRSCRAAQNQAWILANEPRYRSKVRARICRQYGITLADFNQMLADQGLCCAICGLPLGSRHQTVDHDHDSGRIRGVVHRHCNLALGNAHEDPRVLIGCLLYLRRHHPTSLIRYAFELLTTTSPQELIPCRNSD
ncbi:MAG: hypothetical protein HY859_09075 [Caulobacterales bacterium]|nr:hypothetical protein [Caulobacterales bacterium]